VLSSWSTRHTASSLITFEVSILCHSVTEPFVLEFRYKAETIDCTLTFKRGLKSYLSRLLVLFYFHCFTVCYWLTFVLDYQGGSTCVFDWLMCCDPPNVTRGVGACQSRASDHHHSSRSLVIAVVVVVARLIGLAFSDDIKSGNGPGNFRRHRACTSLYCCQNTVAVLDRMSRRWHAPCLYYAFFPLFILLCRRATLNPCLGKKIVRMFSFPVCASVFSGVRTVREQSEQSTISCVINESYYIAGVSPDCMLSTPTMIARHIPPINQSESPQVGLTGASQRTPQQAYITPSRKLIRPHYSCQHTPVKFF